MLHTAADGGAASVSIYIMRFLSCCRIGFLLCLLSASALAQSPTVYSSSAASPDGIGKIYLGREIAQVMGHAGADWLERPSREAEERTDKLVAFLARRLKPDAVVADIGAGSGYFTFRIAPLVPHGKVLAEDIDTVMLKMIDKRKTAAQVANVETILGTTTDPKLPPGGVDVVILVDTYHEWDHPLEMMKAVLRELKPGGQVIQLEYRAEDSSVQILPHHKMMAAQARKEMEAAGLHWLETIDTLPQQHLLVYEKSMP